VKPVSDRRIFRNWF